MKTADVLEIDHADSRPARAYPRADGLIVDLISACLAIATFVMIAADSSWGARAPIVLLFALFVPGWTIVRSHEAPASAFTYIGAVGLSVGLLILLGEFLVLFGSWKWFPAGLVLAGGCGVVGIRSILRRNRELQISFRRPPWATRTAASDIARQISIGSVFAGNLLVALGIRHTRQQAFGVLGLVDVLAAAYWIGLVVLVGGLVTVCSRRSRWAWLNVAALVAALHGLPGLLEPNPRFNVAWLHTGFVKQIADHGTLLRGLDARFSWAGFFAGGGLIQRWTGTESLLWLVRYAPLFYNGAAVV
ncbi:MAG: hypothetical protein QOJ74_2531, partial [Ilumatobacteraceae bacterium]|nr:hypothetical protein [Ilumatobacteraceae bacterium]